jgi:predicted dehydrogenase
VKRLGVGIVGANWAARGHLPAWRMLPEQVATVAVCTTRAESASIAAQRFGLERAYHDFAAMLEDTDIDIVSLGSPPPARYEMTMSALARGKHVFSCIPFSVTVEQARTMAALQNSSSLVGALDAYFQWTPGFSFLKDLIDDDYLGELYAVNVDFSMSQFVMPSADYAYRWTGNAKNGTGVVPNSGSHVFHTLIHLFGPIVEVVGQTKIAKTRWIFDDGTTQVPDVPDTAVILARLANGALVNIHSGRSVPSGTGLILSAYGSKGRLVARSPSYPLDRNVKISGAKPVRLFENSEMDIDIPERYFEVPGGRPAKGDDASVAISLGRLYSNMVRAINDGTEARPNFRRGALVQSIVAAVQRSEQSRSWQRVEPEETLTTPETTN